jgi:hypothetical protein
MIHRRQPVLVSLQAAYPQSEFFHLDRSDLDLIIETLNRGKDWPYSAPLICLMERLKDCGGNLQKMMDADPELAKIIREVCTTVWAPYRKTRGARLVLQPVWKQIKREPAPEPGQAQMRPDRYAALLFHVGTLNPEWDKLAGPCARCGRYYLKNRASQDTYCSRECGNRTTAAARTRERIKAEHDDKMNRSKAALKDWKRAKNQQDWKRWVSQKTGIDLRFLTRNFTESGGVKSTQKEK